MDEVRKSVEGLAGVEILGEESLVPDLNVIAAEPAAGYLLGGSGSETVDDIIEFAQRSDNVEIQDRLDRDAFNFDRFLAEVATA